MLNENTCSAGPVLGPSLAEYCSASTYVAFATILNSLLRSKEEISGLQERVQSVDPDDEYDFVIVGGGAAGAAIASRLSEIPKCKILLMENGPDESVAAQVPMLLGSLLSTPLDWNYTTGNENYCCLETNGSCTISSGKMLGGSTAHNGMLYLRGTPADFNGWAALGLHGWSWDDVLPFFKKCEDNGEIQRVGSKYHSTGGPLSVGRLPYVPAFGYSLLAASEEVGLGVSEDLNGEDITGFSYMQTMSKHGVRCSSAAAYLRPVRHRKNLHISLETTGTKVIIENGTAVGVQYYKNGEYKTIKVTKEVVVSAGAVGSPKLLLLSGIGPKDHLKSVGVEVVNDLPGVGENMHDHIAFRLTYSINDTNAYDYNQAVADEYIANQTGPLSGTGLSSMRARVATNLTTPDDPDIRLGFTAYMSSCAPAEATMKNSARTVTLNVINIQPNSRGRVILASKDPFEYPVVWGNYLNDSTDVERLIQGLMLSMPLADTEALKAWNMTMVKTPVAACSNYTFASRKYWTCAIRHTASSDNHVAGTCKMGNSSDSMAVVDHKLRVYGIAGLRVADTSIMPQITSGNTAAPAMMIGERCAHFIKEYWRYDS